MHSLRDKIIMKLLLRRNFNVTTLTKRSLFNKDFLGLTAYKKKRDEALASSHSENFLNIFEESYLNPNQKVLSHKIKQVSYYVKTKEEADLVGKALEKHAISMPKGHVVFQQFSSGPEIMRMYHFLNMPVEGMSLLQKPDTLNFFADIKSYLIIQDLLYNNGFYHEVCELFTKIQEKEFHVLTAITVCYFQNTSESYKKAMDVFQDFVKYYKRPVWPILMYTMILALENGDPKLPLQYTLGKDSTSDNIQLASLIRTGDITAAFNYFNKMFKHSTIIHSVALELYSNLEKSNELSRNESEILKKIIDSNSFKNQTFDELAAETIHSLNSLEFYSR